MPEDYDGTPLPDDHSPEHSENQDDNIPDWMKEAGWETSSGTFDESKPVFDDLEDEEEIVPADIPSWLEEAAPEGFSFDSSTEADADQDTDNDPDAFIKDDFDFSEPERPASAEEQTPEPAEEPPSEEEKFDVPTWLENLELDEDSQETAVAWLENMPEDLRATDEELKAAEDFSGPQPESTEEPIDELAWMDDLAGDADQTPEMESDEAAALSEDLDPSELIPEPPQPEQIFDQDEIETYDSTAPSWLSELSQDEGEPSSPLPAETISPAEPESEDSGKSMLPDWLSELSPEDELPSIEPETVHQAESEPEPVDPSSDELPDWLGDFESGDAETTIVDEVSVTEETSETLEWLDSLSGEEAVEEELPDIPTLDSLAPDEEETPPVSPADQEAVSPNDDTLNTQIPSWLSQIGETDAEEESFTAEQVEEPEPDLEAESDLQASASWLDQIGEDIPGEADLAPSDSEREVLDWLDSMGSESAPDQTEAIDDLRESLDEMEPDQELDLPDLETAKYFDEIQGQPSDVEVSPEELEEDLWEPATEAPTESEGDDLPDWLSELSGEQEEDEISLESAIRQSGRELNDAEMEFLNRSEEMQADNSDWLSKLDEQDQVREPEEEASPEEPSEADSVLPGGILDRLNEKDELDQEVPDAEIPRWLEDLKVEEDPQETAVLWLQEFIEKGDRANVHDEIKRYTDELDPGDVIPKWMEDLKNEEDPQTTAMLWLEKFSAGRTAPEPAAQTPPQDDSSDWLAELEREEAGQADETPPESGSEFSDSGEGWLADLDIDEKLKQADADLPEWSGQKGEGPTAEQEEEPSWMKATSPLEGDVNTDELAGQQKEVEIPAWLAGYGEGEEPEESDFQESTSQAAGEETTKIDATVDDSDEYTWVSAEETPKPKREPLDLNIAAISQLESILGISYQVAKGIVHYREKQGPYRDFADLLNVPEIVDEQTIEILKPEVFIGAVEVVEPEEILEKEEESKPTPKKKAKSTETYQEVLDNARASLTEANIAAAVGNYGKLIKKKEFLAETITDLQQAILDHPLEINLFKTLGDAYMQSDKLDEALEAYSKAEDLLA